jgi:hypothetical protein
MTEEERREVLEGIARDSDCYPRDRIAAIRALDEMDDGIPEGDFADLYALAPKPRR